jgi:hypothetical protein
MIVVTVCFSVQVDLPVVLEQIEVGDRIGDSIGDSIVTVAAEDL